MPITLALPKVQSWTDGSLSSSTAVMQQDRSQPPMFHTGSPSNPHLLHPSEMLLKLFPYLKAVREEYCDNIAHATPDESLMTNVVCEHCINNSVALY